jgi:nitrous oxidase accessory protein
MQRWQQVRTTIVLGVVFFLLSGECLADVLEVDTGELASALRAAEVGDTLLLVPGVHPGPITIDRAITLLGEDGAIVDGGGVGTTITVDAPGVHIENITVQGSGQQLSTEDSGLFITALGDEAKILGNRFEGNLIGVYLKGPANAVVQDNTILGRQDLRVNERGNGIQIWNSPGSIVQGNRIRHGRDGIFVTTSRDNIFRNNDFADVRFAVHYMYTNNSSVIDNLSTGNKVGYALMSSTQLTATGNRSIGDSDRGIFFNFTNDSIISGNTVAPGARRPAPEKCVFIYNSNFNVISHNHFEACQIGIHFTAGSEQNKLWENSFIGNRNQVKYVGTRSLEWSKSQQGNYWSDHVGFDLDGDGVANQPYRPNSIADQILWRYPMAKLLMNSPVLQILQWAQSEFPALHPGGVTDSHPLMQPLNTGAAG